MFYTEPVVTNKKTITTKFIAMRKISLIFWYQVDQSGYPAMYKGFLSSFQCTITFLLN